MVHMIGSRFRVEIDGDDGQTTTLTTPSPIFTGCVEKHSHAAAHHPLLKPPAVVSTAVSGYWVHPEPLTRNGRVEDDRRQNSS